jgi:hypothetical protein
MNRGGVFRTVSGLAERKKAVLKTWEIRLMPKKGFVSFTSMIFSLTGRGGFGLFPRYGVSSPA